MLPLFKKSHIHSRHVEDLLKTGAVAAEYAEESNKRNALRQAGLLYRIVDGELFRHGTQREYQKYGLRMVVHDDQPDKKAEIIAKCHIDNMGSHLGMNNTIKNVCDTYYWQGVSAHVKMYLKQCEMCKARSKFNAQEWLELERKNIDKKKELAQISHEAQLELKNLGRVKKPSPPETFFIVNAESKANFESEDADLGMMIDSNNIEYVVETLGQSDGIDLEEVCHVMNVPDIVPIPERFRSREIEAFLRDGSFPDDFTSNMKCGLRGPAAQYRIINDELHHEGNKVGSKGLRLVIHDDLPALKVKVMVECHIDEDGSHHGLNKTLNRIGEKYYWTGMSVDVRKFMMHCKICSEQRGKRTLHDGKEYEEEAQQVKSRHLKKMNEMEASGSDMQLTAVPVSYDSADIEPTEGFEQEGHQVIRLIGPNKEITEITVAVVNQETVTAENAESDQMIEEGENDGGFDIVAGAVSKGQSLVTKEMTDAVAQIEAAEAAMEMAEIKNQNSVKTEEESQVEYSDNNENSEQVVIVKNEPDAYSEEENEENPDSSEVAEEAETVETGEEMTQVEGEMTQIETEDGVVNVLIIKEGEEEQEKAVGIRDVDTTESDNMIIMPSGEEQTLKEVARQSDNEVIEMTVCFSHYKDVIYVPDLKKTRIIENFLKCGTRAEGFSNAALLEISENFEIVDDVLYRRASRYKGRQIVVHDDSPEMKLKIISDLHLKRSGAHCSELITHQNVAFKYFWEEMKWDIHRWYPTCKICVNDEGIERRSNKKILSVVEQKKLLEEKRREHRLSGAAALRSREFRNKVKHKINKFELIGKQEPVFEITDAELKKMDGALSLVEVKGMVPNEDVEYYLPQSEEGGKAHVVKVRKRAGWNVLYDLLIYATLEQEQCVKEMYIQKGWKYNLVSLVKAPNEENLDSDEDYYMLTMKVTSVQENAIKDLFQTMGLAIEACDDSKLVGKLSADKISQTHTPGPDIKEKEPETSQKQEPFIKKVEVLVKKPEPAGQTEEPVVQNLDNDEAGKEARKAPALELQKHLQESVAEVQTPVQAPVIPIPVELCRVQDKEQPSVTAATVKTATVRKNDGSETPGTSKIRKIDNVVSTGAPKYIKPDGSMSQVSKTTTSTESPVKQTTRKVVQGQDQETSLRPATRNITSIESPVRPTSRKTATVESPVTPAVDKSATKRKISETPVSENRRSRREIKRPRRFSPDSSPPKTITVKIEPVSPKKDDRAEIDDTVEEIEPETPKRTKTRGKDLSKNTEAVSSPKKAIHETPKTSRNTRSTHITADVSRNLKSKGEPQLEQNKEKKDVQNTEKGEKTVKAKISVMNKCRIRVKKVPKETLTGSGSKQTETIEENLDDIEVETEDEELIEDKKKSQENKQIETAKEEESDDDNEDHDFDDDDDEYEEDDDDDEMDADEAEDMSVPLQIILEDELESMEAVEEEKGFACSLCNAKFPTRSKCIQHGQKMNCYIKCELCGKLYKKKDMEKVKNHTEQHKKGESFPCRGCKKVFVSDEHLKIHERLHKEEVLTSCGQCKEKFHSWFQYASHMVHKHGECNMFTCDVCSAKFASINFMKSEIRFDGKLSYFKCIMCSS